MEKRSLPPGPPPAKNIFEAYRLLQQLDRDSLGVFMDWARTYGDVYGLQILTMQQYMIVHPDDIHQVTVTEAAKFSKDASYTDEKRGLARFLGNGLLNSNGEFWKRQRRLVAPALHTKRIDAYAETMVDFTAQMLAGWRDGARLDIAHEMSALTMRIVAKTLLGSNVDDEIDTVYAAMNVIQKASGDMSLLPDWVPTPQKWRADRAVRDLDRIIYGMIAAWREQGEDRGDLLSMLLLAEDEDGSWMSDKQVRDEAVTLFMAGHETTANTLNWTWYLLAQHPEVEARLHDEVDRVLAGRLPTLDDLKRLPYTDMVIKESMRLYPPAWSFGRMALEDVEIGGYHIPKGSTVGIFSYGVHRDPRWWDQPEAFDPERFSPEREGSLHKYAYIPFGAGPRICIGNAFAQMEARLLLAAIASRFTLHLSPGQQVPLQPLVTLNPKGGLPMVIRERVRERATVYA